MMKLPYQLITNIVSFLGEYVLTKVLEALSFGPAMEESASKFINYSAVMPFLRISRIELTIWATCFTTMLSLQLLLLSSYLSSKSWPGFSQSWNKKHQPWLPWSKYFWMRFIILLFLREYTSTSSITIAVFIFLGSGLKKQGNRPVSFLVFADDRLRCTRKGSYFPCIEKDSIHQSIILFVLCTDYDDADANRRVSPFQVHLIVTMIQNLTIISKQSLINLFQVRSEPLVFYVSLPPQNISAFCSIF